MVPAHDEKITTEINTEPRDYNLTQTIDMYKNAALVSKGLSDQFIYLFIAA